MNTKAIDRNQLFQAVGMSPYKKKRIKARMIWAYTEAKATFNHNIDCFFCDILHSLPFFPPPLRPANQQKTDNTDDDDNHFCFPIAFVILTQCWISALHIQTCPESLSTTINLSFIFHPSSFFRSAAAVARRDPADTILTAGIRNQSAVRAVHGKNSCVAYRLKIARVHFELANFNPANATDKCDLHLLPLLFFRSATAPDFIWRHTQGCCNALLKAPFGDRIRRPVFRQTCRGNSGEFSEPSLSHSLPFHYFVQSLRRAHQFIEVIPRQSFIHDLGKIITSPFLSHGREQHSHLSGIREKRRKIQLWFLWLFFHSLHLLDILDDSFVMPPSRQDMADVPKGNLHLFCHLSLRGAHQNKLRLQLPKVELPTFNLFFDYPMTMFCHDVTKIIQ